MSIYLYGMLPSCMCKYVHVCTIDVIILAAKRRRKGMVIILCVS